ncbi:MAG: hypothetical protein MMC33_007719 [Icmadophila ericetorum]|nr:hypothetical protein [Icmadophila ericetorum]
MSWFWRGFQSAVFYYVSCAPCTQYNDKRRRRTESRRTKAEKEAIEATQPEIYRHPSPFSTNIYWREEMALGPGPPKKGNKQRGSRAGSSRELTTGSVGSSTGGSSLDTTLVVDSLEGDGPLDTESRSEIGWNRRRYQRPDEMIWGIDIDPDDPQNPSIGLSTLSTVNTTKTYSYTARNPAVNDLHPPVVSTHPTKKSETKWMLQPPPSAKIMEGKVRATTRSRSTSGGSYGSSMKRDADSTNLRKQISERSPEQKTLRGKRPSADSLRQSESWNGDNPSGFLGVPSGQRHDRDTPSSLPKAKRVPPPPLTILNFQENQRPTTAPQSYYQRPPLSTIPSSSTVTPRRSPPTAHLLSPKPTRPPFNQTVSSSSLRILQELVSPSSALNRRAGTPTKEAQVRLPQATEEEEAELVEVPELETKWMGKDFRFPGSPPEPDLETLPKKDPFVWNNTQLGSKGKDRAARWSMDI